MATQNAQMARKVEVVDEVKTRMSAATASIVSEYRGLTVAELAALRHARAAVGGDYKNFKNTLVRHLCVLRCHRFLHRARLPGSGPGVSGVRRRRTAGPPA